MMIGDENVKGILTGWGLTTKPCDSCKTSSAILFCRRDSAFLCGACDAKIHHNNNNSSNNNHERVILCEVCEQAPAAVTCKADAAALCVSCDHDIHSANPLASRHDRVPVVPFFHSSEVAAAPKSSSAFLVPENNNTDLAPEAWLMPNPGGSKVATNDFFLSDIDALLNFNYTAPSLDIKPPQDHHRRNINSGDSVVPTFSAANGNLNGFVNHHPKENNYFDIDFQKPKISPFTHSVSSSDVGIVPDGNSNSHTEVSNYSFPKTIEAIAAAPPPVQLSREEREARVMRYREKRKNRKFEKTIRYASRKAYAESRPRIKGRFAKRGETDADEGMMMFGGGGGGRGGVGGYFMVDDGGFGVVPSF